MSAPLPPLLFVDDERNARRTFEGMMGAVCPEYEVRTVESAEEALKLLAVQDFFMVITDARLGGMTGYELIKQVKARRPELPVLMITAYDTSQLAVEAMKSGAIDYLPKPFDPDRLRQAIGWSARDYRKTQEIAALRARIGEAVSLDQIIGECPAMGGLRDLIRTVAPTNATVLILGESGTGKELVAGAVHGLSARREKNYVRINCAAIPETLLESELFGHEKGSFTGAMRQKAGRVEEADGGTIFLDEIGDMSRPLQAKLLRFLEDGSFTRVGGNQELRVNVRLIAATNRDIIQAIRQNSFREDLFHRLNVVQFRPPPLRERGRDVLLLAEHFLRHFAGAMSKEIRRLSPAAQEKLLGHHWPGNVRELRNVIERAVILATTDTVEAEQIPDFAVENRLRRPDLVAAPATAGSLDEQMAAFERHLILDHLQQTGRDLAATAARLGVSVQTLRYRLRALNIRLDPHPGEETMATADRD
jgi:DNA-binding NtrC family response regulator